MSLQDTDVTIKGQSEPNPHTAKPKNRPDIKRFGFSHISQNKSTPKMPSSVTEKYIIRSCYHQLSKAYGRWEDYDGREPYNGLVCQGYTELNLQLC